MVGKGAAFAAELIELSKKQQITLGTSGVGSASHMTLARFNAATGAKIVHVPYRGVAPAVTDMVAARLDLMFASYLTAASFVESGQLRLLATFADKRSRRWPQAPTLLELGYGIVAMSPYGIGGPRGLPADVLDKLHRAFHAAMLDPAHLAEIGKYDQELTYLGPRDYEQALREAFLREKEIVARLGLARSGG